MNIKNQLQLLSLCLLISLPIKAQLTPQQAIKGMMRGINIGNTMESPTEGSWGNPPLKKQAFTDYKNAGLTAIRIPITWDAHVSKSLPYAIDSVWLNRVDSVVTWGLAQKLFIIINMHHESWIKKSYTDANKARFDSIWNQIATRFKDKSDSLIFEMINEPEPLSQTNVNELNKKTLATIRKTNPTRIVLFSGHSWSNSDHLVSAAIPNDTDKYLMEYYHSYDPYPFGLEGPGTYGSDNDINTTRNKFKQVADWSAKYGIPVILGEYAYNVKCDYNSRMCAYATVVDLALQYGVGTFAWDDGSNFTMYNRKTGVFNEIKDIVINTYNESPNKLTIGNYADTLIKLKWNNRTTNIDSISIERKIGDGSFSVIAKVDSLTTQFIDNTVKTGVTYTYRLKTNLKDSVEIQSWPVKLNNAAVVRKTYLTAGNPVPGTIEAENFDIGIEGLTYHDVDIENIDGKYRVGNGVDIAYANTKYFISHNEVGEWQEYTINVANTAMYKIDAYIAADTAGGMFSIQFDNNKTLTFSCIKTTNLETFAKVTDSVELTAGTHIMRVTIVQKTEFNINRYVFSGGNVSSIKDLVDNSITVFPNPALDKLVLQNVEKPSKVCIYNMSGHLVFEKNIIPGENILSIEKLKSGVYSIKCTNAVNSFCTKFVKK
jgi:aryl-phospho-beta-D-glucosidase BglC (GH1 family)